MLDMTLTAENEEALRETREAVYEATNGKLLAEQTRDKAVKAAAQDGASLREIATAVGLSHQRVAQLVGKRWPENPDGCLWECDTLDNGVTYHNDRCPNAA